ncbi:MAG: acetyl-CoA carboxylase biotin carboxyl carrier protein [Bacteroidota bacterium]|jgi:acetyl-CoA carboxylase biotin carboxyl carrier protein|nr:acetyl-CoA carboxylase biotin carboxyl carrier protein [Bacteroidota bacterium]GDX47509.1 acetyl-CoA carboxylase, biotin carboxyl carrier protein [Bacteroidota bacterium]
MEFKEIQELIRMVSKSNLAEIRIEKDSFKITIRTRDYYTTSARATEAAPVTYAIPPIQAPVTAPVQTATSAPVSGSEAPKEKSNSGNENSVSFKSPMVGTFYRAAGPDKEPFVKVGDIVKPGTVLCVVEAMKLFNEIESDISGKIVKIMVDNAKPVEYDQPLFIIEPM